MTSKSAATLTKETKASLKQARALVESESFDIGMEAVTGFTGGAISGQANKAIEKSNSVGNTTSNASQSVSAKSADAIKVMQNEKPIMYNLWRRR